MEVDVVGVLVRPEVGHRDPARSPTRAAEDGTGRATGEVVADDAVAPHQRRHVVLGIDCALALRARRCRPRRRAGRSDRSPVPRRVPTACAPRSSSASSISAFGVSSGNIDPGTLDWAAQYSLDRSPPVCSIASLPFEHAGMATAATPRPARTLRRSEGGQTLVSLHGGSVC